MSKKQKIWSLLQKNKLNLFVLLWFTLAWSWPLMSQATSITLSPLLGHALAIIVIVTNISISTTLLLCVFSYLDKIFTKQGKVLSLVTSLVVLAFTDFAVAWLTSLIWVGPGSKIDNILPLGSPALLLANTPLGFTSRIIGFYGLAAVFWLVVYLLFKNKIRLAFITTSFFVGLAVVSSIAWHSANGENINVVIVSEYATDKVPTIDTNNVNLVVFPEYGLDNIDNTSLNKRLIKSGQKTLFVGSAGYNSNSSNGGHYNTLLFGNSIDGFTDRQDKYRLIPGGENLPYVGRIVLTALGQTEQITALDYNRRVIASKQRLENFSDRDMTLGSGACSSILSPEDYRRFSKQGATILTNSASLSIFTGSQVFAWQQQSLGKFMAVANARPFLQSANSSTAYAIDHTGRFVAQIRPTDSRVVTIQNNTKKTPYTMLGEVLAISGGLYLLIDFCWHKITHKISKKRYTKN